VFIPELIQHGVELCHFQQTCGKVRLKVSGDVPSTPDSAGRNRYDIGTEAKQREQQTSKCAIHF